MIGKIIMAVTAILLSVNVLSIIIHLWLLRRRKYAVVPRAGYDESYEYMDWEDNK